MESAWEDDQDDWSAVYLMYDRHEPEIPVLYFALKCGMLSSPFPIDIVKLFDDEKEKIIKDMPDDKLETLEYIKEFIRDAETNPRINKVASTTPGIELSQFCINMEYRDLMKSKGIDTKGIGEYAFFNYIEPLVQRIREEAGCRFIYLFAADNTDDERLIKYYREHLGFITLDEFDPSLYRDKEFVPIMPLYDYRCEFMVWPIEYGKE